ncbi:MAG: GMC family oxidoreductase [Nitrospirae bacterium]|nr:GMC family oxidoreductase [Nitrospirota bacterium]
MPTPRVEEIEKRRWDVCVVGSGAGGGAAAYRLGTLGVNTLVLEAGPRFSPSEYRLDRPGWDLVSFPLPADPRWKEKDRYTSGTGQPLPAQYSHLQSTLQGLRRYQHPPDRRAPFVYEHARGVGGSTLHFQGEAHRFHPSAFRMRTLHGVGEDWPLTYDDLAPFYDGAERVLGVAGSAENPFKPPRGPYPLPPHRLSWASRRIARAAGKLGLQLLPNSLAILSQPYDGRPPCNYCAGCTWGCPLRDKGSWDQTFLAKAEATGRVWILPEALVHRVETDKQGRVSGVLFSDKEGRERRVKARVVLLACGAIETPRLLLNSAGNQFPHGLANGSGQVGKHFLETVHAGVTGRFADRLDAHRGLPIDSRIWDFVAPDPRRGFTAGCVLGVSQIAGDLLSPFRHAVSLSAAWGTAHKAFMRKSFGRVVHLFGITDQLPNPGSRVVLDPTVKDAFGLPVARIEAALGENEWRAMAFILNTSRDLLAAAGAEEILGQTTAFDLPHASHVFGTCRMGTDPSKSIVNAEGRAHEAPNLYILDASLFPTAGGGDSPSLTIAAVALRAAGLLAERLKEFP